MYFEKFKFIKHAILIFIHTSYIQSIGITMTSLMSNDNIIVTLLSSDKNITYIQYIMILECSVMCLELVYYNVKNVIMSVHHGISILSLYMSFELFPQISSYILALHHVSDMLLNLAKVYQYKKKHIEANFIFLLFIMSWNLTRLYLYPKFIYTCLYSIDNIQLLWGYSWFHDIYDFKHIEPYIWCSIIMLSLLFIMHVYWTILIYKKFINIFS